MSGEDVTADFVVVDEVELVIYDVGSGNSGGDAQQTQSVSGGSIWWKHSGVSRTDKQCVR